MMRQRRFILLGMLLLAMHGSGLAFARGSAAAILEKIDAVRAPAQNFVFDIKLTYRKNNRETLEERYNVRIKNEKSLVKFLYPPANKGRLLLMAGNNMWIYIPGTRGPIRISPQQRLLGQIATGDVARVVYSLDYQAELRGRETVNAQDCLKLELSPKTEFATYAKIIMWAEADTYQPLKAEFYTLSGKLLKTAYYKGYSRVLGVERPMLLEVHDGLRPGEHSLMEYSNMIVEDTPDAYFQRDYMIHML